MWRGRRALRIIFVAVIKRSKDVNSVNAKVVAASADGFVEVRSV